MLAYTAGATLTEIIGTVIMFFSFSLATSRKIETALAKGIFWFIFVIGLCMLLLGGE